MTETAYQDESITVQITEYRISGTTVHVADVQLSSPEYLKTAFAENTYGRNVTAKVSETADAAGAKKGFSRVKKCKTAVRARLPLNFLYQL